MSTIYGWDPEFSKARRRVANGAGNARDEERVAGGQSLDQRVLMRGLFDGSGELARYFAPSNHHRPGAHSSFAENDLELYDTVADPDELPRWVRSFEARVHRSVSGKGTFAPSGRGGHR